MKAPHQHVLPPLVYLIIAVIMYITTVLLMDVVTSFFLDELELILPLHQAGLGVLGFITTAYAAYRVFGFHPLFQLEYQDWLRSSPWTFEKPLPFGPVQIVPQDLLVVGIMTAFSLLHVEATPFIIPATFLITYVSSIACVALILGMFRKAYLIAFGLGVVVYYHNIPWLSAVVLLGLYGVAWQVIEESLRKFRNWDEEWLGERSFLKFNIKDAPQRKNLGWPHDLMAPVKLSDSLAQTTVVAVALLAGWWSFVLLDVLNDEVYRLPNQGNPTPLLVGVACYLAVFRLFAYCGNYASPISLPGRIFTGRLIIPRYDYVFIAPAMALLITPLLLLAAYYWEWNYDYVVPFIVFVQFYCLGQGPSFDTWKLTGHHRIRAPLAARGDLVQTQ